MHPDSHDMFQALAKERMDRYRGEASNHRLASIARKGRSELHVQKDSRMIHALRTLLAGALERTALVISPSVPPSENLVATE